MTLFAPEDLPRGAQAAVPLSKSRDSLMPVGGPHQDTERAMLLCEVLAPGTGEMKMTIIDGDPPSKSRPRFTRQGRPYRTKEDVDAEKRTAAHLRRVFTEPWTGNVALGAVFFRPNKQRIDVDNMLKHVCDAANEIAWLDDSQVTAVYGVAELDIERPRTILVFARHRSTLTRGTDNTRPCERCGVPFLLVGTTKKRFCSQECARKARGHDLSEPVPCQECGQPFRRTTQAQILCSAECRADRLRGRNRAKGSPRSRCASCDKTLSHTRGGRCRACWRANPNGGDA